MNFMRTIPFLLLALAAAVLPRGPAIAADDNVQVDIQVFRVLGDFSGDLSLTDDIWSGIDGPELETKRAFTFFTRAKANLADVRLTVDDHGWTWNESSKIPFGTEGEKAAEALGDRVTLLAHPTAIVPVGSSATIQIAAEQTVEYFKRVHDNVFELKTTEQPTGLSLSMGVERKEKGRILLKDFTVTSRIIEERKPIEGVTLNVGEPVLRTRRFEASMNVKPGVDYGILMHAKDVSGLLLIRLRAGPPTAGNEGDLPSPPVPGNDTQPTNE